MQTALIIFGIWVAVDAFIVWCVNRWEGWVHLQELHHEDQGTLWPPLNTTAHHPVCAHQP